MWDMTTLRNKSWSSPSPTLYGGPSVCTKSPRRQDFSPKSRITPLHRSIWGRLPKVGLGFVQDFRCRPPYGVQSPVFRSQSNTVVSIFPHPSCPLVFFPSLPPRNLLDLHCSLVLVGQTNFHINGAHSQMRALRSRDHGPETRRR